MTQSPIESSHSGTDTDSFLMTICQYRERERQRGRSVSCLLSLFLSRVRQAWRCWPWLCKVTSHRFLLLCQWSEMTVWQCGSPCRVVTPRDKSRAGLPCYGSGESVLFQVHCRLWRCRGGDTPLWSSVSLRFLNWHEFHTWSSQVRDAVNNKRILE